MNVEKWRMYCGICLSNRRLTSPRRPKAAELDKNPASAVVLKRWLR